MGLKFTVETIGELRAVLRNLPDELTFQCLFDGADYRKLDVQSMYDNDPEGRLVVFSPAD
jgi:hypothetical protein